MNGEDSSVDDEITIKTEPVEEEDNGNDRVEPSTEDPSSHLKIECDIKEEMESSSLDHSSDIEIENDTKEENQRTPHMSDKHEQRLSIKFCVKLRKSSTETLEMIRQAYGDKALSRSRCFKWYSRFSMGLTSIEDAKRSGRPCSTSTSKNFQRIEQLVLGDRTISIRKISEILRIPCSSCHHILTTKLNFRRISEKLVPRLLTEDEKQERVEMCVDLLDTAKADSSFISRIISCGESWIYGYDAKPLEKQARRKRKPKIRKEAVKSLLIIFFDIRGIVHWEFVPSDQAAIAETFCNILKNLQEKMRQKRPNLWHTDKWMLLEHTPFHTSLKINKFLAKNHMVALPHPNISPTCSPDLLPWDFALFPKLRKRLMAIGIETAKDVPSGLQAQLDKFQENDFQDAFEDLMLRWERCIKSQGDYFEEDLGENE